MSILAGIKSVRNSMNKATQAMKDKRTGGTSSSKTSYTPTSTTQQAPTPTSAPKAPTTGSTLATAGSTLVKTLFPIAGSLLPATGGMLQGGIDAIKNSVGRGGSSYTPQQQAQGTTSYAPAPTPAQPGAPSVPGVNDHQAYINQNWQGGMDAYIKNQQERLNGAYASGDQGLIDRLNADAQRVGYTLQAPQMPQQQLAPQQMVEQQSANIGSIVDSARQIGQQYAQQSDEHAAAVAAQYTQMVDLLNKLEAQITGQIRSQMNGDDPGLQAALGVIRQEAERMRNESLEDLNARGLVQSGVYAEALSRLNSGELTSIQQTVAAQFGDLQTQLNNSLMSLAQARIQALSGSQSTLNNMLMNDRQTQADLGMKGLDLGLEQRNQDLQNNQFYAGLQNQWNIAQMDDSTKRYGIGVGAESDKYGVDKNYDLGKYKADLDYNQGIYGIDKNYSASIYGSNISAQNAQLRVDQQNQEAEAERQQLVQEQTNELVNQGVPEISKQAIMSGQGLNEVIEAINNSTYEEEAKQAARAAAQKFFSYSPGSSLTPYNMKDAILTNYGGRSSYSSFDTSRYTPQTSTVGTGGTNGTNISRKDRGNRYTPTKKQ